MEIWSTSRQIILTGLMEGQIYSLLGVEPVRSMGRVTGFEVISQENMNHPRIDVVITPSGLYRDTFPYQIELIDEAVRTIAALNEANETNYVRWNSLKMEDALITSGYNNTAAQFQNPVVRFSSLASPEMCISFIPVFSAFLPGSCCSTL